MIAPLFLALQMLQLEQGPVLALIHPHPSIRNTDKLEHVQRMATKMGRVLKYMMHKETTKRPEFAHPEADEAKRRRANCCPQLLNGSLQPDGARLLMDMHSVRTGGNR